MKESEASQMSENHNNHNGNGHTPDPEEKFYEISERARNNPAFNPAAAAYVRELAKESRKNRKPFDRAKFEELLDTDPVLYNMRFRVEDDE